MKKYLSIVLSIVLSIALTQAQTRSFKRGLGFNALMPEDIAALSPGVSWVYNWGHSTPGNDMILAENGIVYIPMAWSGIDKTTVRTLLSAHPEIKYILGFNEPNFNAQANLTPTEAAAKWPDIEEIADEFGLTIVGPALNYSPDAPYQDPIKWYDEFFAACPECRVDHIAVHFYMPSASAIKTNVEKFKKYGKPIWLTEFCAWETNTTQPAQKKFMIETLDYLEKDPDVFRYAWFMSRGAGGRYPYYQLLDNFKAGELTDLGEVYTHISSYDNDFYFIPEQQIPFEHYIGMNRINMEKTTDESGHVNLYEMSVSSWVDYNIDIPEDGEYNIFFRLSAEFPDESEVYVSVNGTEITSMIFEKKGVNVWNTQSCKGMFTKGKQKIRIGFKKGGLRLNWWAISRNEDAPPSGIGSVHSDNNATVYPNPVKDILYIQSPDNNTTVSLFDIYGKCIYKGMNLNTIDMSAFTSGMYILNIQNENGGRTVEKIWKED